MDFQKKIFFITLIFASSLFPVGLLGQPIAYGNGKITYNIAWHEDKTATLTIEQIAGLDNDSFTGLKEKELSAGFSHSAYWLKVDSSSFLKDNNYYFEIEFPPLDRVDFYYKKNGKFVSSVSGDSVPNIQHDVKSRNLVYFYKFQEPQSLYFRIKTNSTIYFPLTVWNEKAYHDRKFYEQFYMGAYFGVIIIMVIYNFFLYLNIREKLYLYYVAYVSCLALFMLVDHGYARLLLWDNNITLNNIMNPLMGQVTTILAIFLTVHFLRMQKRLGIMIYLLGAEVAGLVLGIAGIFFIDYKYLLVYVNILVILTVVSLILMAVREAFLKNRMAYFYLVAFGGFMIIVFYSSLANIGIVPQSFSSTYGMVFASAFEVSVLSFALGYRINRLKKEKEFYKTESTTTRHTYNLLKNEIEIAARIQSSILPAGTPDISGLVIEASYLPHGNVGGDFYDFAEISEFELGMLVADVTGHGIPAALLASMANFSFTYEKEFVRDVAEILKRMNRSLFNRLGKQFVTAIYAYLNLKTMQIDFSSCGHPPLIIYRNKTNEIFADKPKGRMMGVFEQIVIEKKTVALKAGDRILIYTDGVSESIGDGADHDGMENLIKLFKQNSGESLKGLKESILKKINESEFQEDDATFILIEVK